jgi:hypothetical protein
MSVIFSVTIDAFFVLLLMDDSLLSTFVFVCWWCMSMLVRTWVMCFAQCLGTLCVSCLRSTSSNHVKRKFARLLHIELVIMYKLFMWLRIYWLPHKFFVTCCCEWLLFTCCTCHAMLLMDSCVVMSSCCCNAFSVVWYRVCVCVCVALRMYGAGGSHCIKTFFTDVDVVDAVCRSARH